jgi:hypothetical protein
MGPVERKFPYKGIGLVNGHDLGQLGDAAALDHGIQRYLPGKPAAGTGHGLADRKFLFRQRPGGLQHEVAGQNFPQMVVKMAVRGRR